MARLIDAKALMDAFRTYMAERFDREKCISEENCKTCDRSCLWRSVVSAAPTVDAVEVVRCWQCKHCDPENHHCDHHMGTAAPLRRKPDDFCSYGERKDGDD